MLMCVSVRKYTRPYVRTPHASIDPLRDLLLFRPPRLDPFPFNGISEIYLACVVVVLRKGIHSSHRKKTHHLI